MARTSQTLSKGGMISHNLSIALLCKTFDFQKISSILQVTDKKSKRTRDLPAEVVVYYVIAMCLFMHVNLKEVLRCLLEGLRLVLGRNMLKVTGKSGISMARSRLGSAPLKALHDECVKPIATPQAPGAFYKNWRLTSLDGSTLDIPDETENRNTFGKHRAKNDTSSPYPQLRFVSLVENGSHVLFGSHFSSVDVGEGTLARQVVKSLEKGMLNMADRLFYGYDLWQLAANTGADLLWRMRQTTKLDVEKKLEDGSYLSCIYKRRGSKKGAVVVRVIEYGLEESSEVYRLITTILDPKKAPAAELAALYSERWEIETVFDELKTHLRGSNICLRSKTPELVKQEFYGLMLAHFAVRGLMYEAAKQANIDPDRLSYTHTVRIIRRRITSFQPFSPSGKKTVSSGNC